MGRPCKCCGSDVKCGKCECFCNPDNPNLKDGGCENIPYDEIPGSPSERLEQFNLYDFTMLICNSNAAKDDEWEITLNKINLGNVSELGKDVCKGKFFTTNEDMLEKIKADVFNDSSKNVDLSGKLYCQFTPLCCMRNTFEQSEHKVVDRQVFNFCGDNPIYFKRTKRNNNANFGYIIIYRTGPSEDHVDLYADFPHDYTGYGDVPGSDRGADGCLSFEKTGVDGISRRYVKKNTDICTAYRGLYIIPNGEVGGIYDPSVEISCCFCNHAISNTVRSGRNWGGPL